jgi:hypothetical protein
VVHEQKGLRRVVDERPRVIPELAEHAVDEERKPAGERC